MFKKENHTLSRINKRLLTRVNEWLLLNQDMDARIITMSITTLDISPDLSNCTVFIQHKDEPTTLAKQLNKRHHPLHQYLFKHLDIRKIPKIKFKVAPKPQTSILDILDDIDAQ